MKPFSFLLLVFCNLLFVCHGQSVGVGTGSPSTTAQLDVTSSSKGFLMPRMTSEQRQAIVNPAVGLMVYQVNGTAGVYHYNGKQWLNMTHGVKPDEDGYLYGTVSTYAGNNAQSADVDGTIDNATFNDPKGLATDTAGNLWMAEPNTNVIRKIATDGTVSTVAGVSGVYGYMDGPGNVANFAIPYAVAVDKLNNVYVVDRDNQRIRKISNGIVSTLAGTGFQGSDDGAGNAATFFYPYAVAVDTSLNVYVADSYNNKIRKISPAGIVSTLAGTGAAEYIDGPGNVAAFNQPQGIAVDISGNVYVADSYNNRIRMITPGGVVSTIAGSGVGSSTDGQGVAATLYHPDAIAVDVLGRMYLTEESTRKIRKISSTGNVTTLTGKYKIGTCSSVDGSMSVANFCNPWGIALINSKTTSGSVYVSDYNTIRKVAALE